jgi:hypothetical protein
MSRVSCSASWDDLINWVSDTHFLKRHPSASCLSPIPLLSSLAGYLPLKNMWSPSYSPQSSIPLTPPLTPSSTTIDTSSDDSDYQNKLNNILFQLPPSPTSPVFTRHNHKSFISSSQQVDLPVNTTRFLLVSHSISQVGPFDRRVIVQVGNVPKDAPFEHLKQTFSCADSPHLVRDDRTDKVNRYSIRRSQRNPRPLSIFSFSHYPRFLRPATRFIRLLVNLFSTISILCVWEWKATL